MKLSVQAPSYNEKKFIKKFINNVKKVADEIILIDNSTDDTPRIAKKMSRKVRVIKYGVKDFSKIRNKGISAVKKGYYIMYLDVDELLSPELIGSIRELKTRKELADAYLIKRKNFFKYKGCTGCLTTRFIKGEPKIFRKGVIKFVNKIHEQPRFIIKPTRTEKLRGETLHYPKVGKYERYGKFSIMDVEEAIKERTFLKKVLIMIKQSIKCLLIFDYSRKYWKGNVKIWSVSAGYLFDFINVYFKIRFLKKEYDY